MGKIYVDQQENEIYVRNLWRFIAQFPCEQYAENFKTIFITVSK